MADPKNTQAAPLSIAEWGAFPFVGTWGFRGTIPIFWHNVAIDPPVRDDVQIIGRIERVRSGTHYTDTISVCGLELPGWRHRSGAHRVVFSDDLFDRGYFPASQATVEQVLHGPGAGSLKSSMVALTVGLRTGDPLNARWCPMRGSSFGEWSPVDADLDGWPGVSAQFDEQDEYTPAAADMLGHLQVSRVGLGLRLRFSHEVWPTSLYRLEGKAFPVSTEHTDSEGNTTYSWPDVRVLAAEVHDVKRGSVEPAKQLHIDWLNNFLTARPDTERDACIQMWRVPSYYTSKDVRNSIR